MTSLQHSTKFTDLRITNKKVINSILVQYEYSILEDVALLTDVDNFASWDNKHIFNVTPMTSADIQVHTSEADVFLHVCIPGK